MDSGRSARRAPREVFCDSTLPFGSSRNEVSLVQPVVLVPKFSSDMVRQLWRKGGGGGFCKAQVNGKREGRGFTVLTLVMIMVKQPYYCCEASWGICEKAWAAESVQPVVENKHERGEWGAG